MWYQYTPYEAYYNAEQYDVVLALANKMLTTPYLEETWYWRAMVKAVKGENEAAINDFDRAIKFNPRFSTAIEAEARLKAGLFLPPTTEDHYAHTVPYVQP
jgi:tetratricopeptide (TPR) repeat protein